MKLNVLKVLLIAVSAMAICLVLTNVSAQKTTNADERNIRGFSSRTLQTHAANVSQEKTVEQVEKNIKVLTGMPQSQLIPVMNFFAASLGRRCNFCHVNKNGQWDYATDEKPEKNTAREMIKLVLDVNKTTSSLNLDPVSCYTCHRGRTSPQSLPPLPLPLPSPAAGQGAAAASSTDTHAGQPQASPSATPAIPTADDIFNKYAAAIGGQQAIDKLNSRVAKGTLLQANGNTLPFELYQAAPDKFYQVVTTQQGPFERGFNGTVGWEKSARGVRELTAGELAQIRATNGLFSLIKLKDQFTRTRVFKDRLNDRDVYVVNGTSADGKRQRLFFDSETGLLVRRVSYTSTMVGVIPDQADFEDYREVDGIKFPFTARVSTIEVGNPMSTRKFSEIKLNVPIDDSKFAMPAPSRPTTTPDLSSADDLELQKHLGETVIMRGRFSLRGKTGPFILVGTRPIYLEPTGSFAWGDGYAKMEDRDVRVTGVLRFARGSQQTNTALPSAGITDHFYFEAETAKVELTPT